MANKTDSPAPGLNKAIAAMVIFGVLAAVLSGASFEVIKVWPQPPSVEPYFGWQIGAVWGAVVGGVFGFILGFLTDDNHFKSEQ